MPLVEADEIRSLTARRERIFASVQSIYDYSKTLTSANVQSFLPRFQKLDTYEKSFDDIQADIIEFNASLTDRKSEIKVNDVQTSFDTLIFEARAAYMLLKGQQEPVAQAPSPIVTQIQLPQLNIPRFSNKMADWPTFFSLFESLVHNNNLLSAIQKFQYLRTLLTDDALAVISEYHLSEENYLLALTALKNRYHNKRRLAQMYIDNILNFGKIANGNSANLHKFLKTHTSSVNAFKALGINDQLDYLLLHLSLHNLDNKTRKVFENKHASSSIPSYQNLIDFITEQCRTNELIDSDAKDSNCGRKPSTSFFAQKTDPKSEGSIKSQPKIMRCPCCQQSHTLSTCSKFQALELEKKYDLVRRSHLCFNCLGPHLRTLCKSIKSCSKCRSNKHHRLLHPEGKTFESKAEATESKPEVTQTPQTSAVAMQNNSFACQVSKKAKPKQVLLGTAVVLVRDTCGQFQPARAVLDCGSQVSAITSSLVQRLGLKPFYSSCEIVGITNERAKVCGEVNCVIASNRSKRTVSLCPVVLSSIVQSLPSVPLPELKNKFPNICLADEEFYRPEKVEMLLGSDVYPFLLEPNSDSSVILGEPSLLKTIFGYVVTGPVASDSVTGSRTSLLAISPSLESILKKFWEQEEVALPILVNPEDEAAESHFCNTYEREASGRYSVSLPFMDKNHGLRNRPAAYKSYLSLERKLSRNEELKASYNSFLQDYLSLSHMSPAKCPSDYLLPHHCVTKVDSSSTKVRVVFNASAPGSLVDRSLNDVLLRGPKLQKALPNLINQFRLYKYALCADIRMMYRQILVDKADRIYQHIFWRPEENCEILEYELNTVTYGLKPAPFLAQRVLLQLVKDEGEKFPLASPVIENQTYMDDILGGADTIEQAQLLQKELVELLTAGCFELRKWSSNNESVLEAVPTEFREQTLSFATEDNIIKILGLIWDPTSDCFQFKISPFKDIVTKRTILSYVARVFDPLGFISPVVHFMKWFLQQLWLSQLDWDTPLEGSLAEEWIHFTNDLMQVSVIKIPRFIGSANCEKMLVGFCDASEKGVAACLYLVVKTELSVQSSLIASKTKIAPLKSFRINRLELSGAHLLTRLLKSPEMGLNNLKLHRIKLYTDSKTVLCWLKTPPYLLNTYVANRVSDILGDTSPTDWGHVKSEDNPADCASRGLKMSTYGANFGGLWEAVVKSTKTLLKRIIGDTILTFEEYSTLFIRIEAVLNSRPLCRLSEDPDGTDYLTPGHFITEAPLLATPEMPIPENCTPKLRWGKVQLMAQAFWK
ncbi:uncharacterized protein LOC123304888, partial [Chrysoperla carnea]|uniref:uncharacterized protein LOC123304888 n=1 Tax=Chrysoperla carnea TaxID=189513 RepID=UPI001D05C583